MRLGVWLPNPRFKGKSGGPRAHRRPGIWFLRELTGVLPADRRYVYGSDGGHLDNLGLLEPVRRRCRTILLIDASGDRWGTTAAFDESLRIAKDLFHAEIVGR